MNIDAVIAKIERTFAQFPHERATMEDMGRVAKVGPTWCSWAALVPTCFRSEAQVGMLGTLVLHPKGRTARVTVWASEGECLCLPGSVPGG